MNEQKEAEKVHKIIDGVLPDEEPKYYIAGIIKSELNVKVLNDIFPVKLNWADGMIGAIPVFTTIQQASEYARDDNVQIMELKAK